MLEFTDKWVSQSQSFWAKPLVKSLYYDVVAVVVVDPKLLSSSLLYSQCQADESACLLQFV